MAMNESPARRGPLGKISSFLKAGQDLLKSDEPFAAECGRVVAKERIGGHGVTSSSHPSFTGAHPKSADHSNHSTAAETRAHQLTNAQHHSQHHHHPQPRTSAGAPPAAAASVATPAGAGDRAAERHAASGAVSELRGSNSEDVSTSGGYEFVNVGRETPKLRAMSEHKIRKFIKILSDSVVDIDALRELAWGGIPADLRPVVWRLLLGYLPPAKARQVTCLARKRAEYSEMVPRYYDISNTERSEEELGALRQVAVDVPRTAPGVPLFHQEPLQASLNRMLYIWGIRHPASGYVQGMNDLVTPFLSVFLSEHLSGPMEAWVVDSLPESILLEVEADCYWCLCKLVECIQDHYTYAQPGIQRTVFKIKELVRRVNEPVAAHLEDQSLDFLQFSFRWVNCLLIREIPFAHSVRLWDTYMAEGSWGFSDFLVYICASFLLTWSDKICQMEFQDLIIFLQKLPTADWDEAQMEMMLSKAHIWRASFGEAQSHLKI